MISLVASLIWAAAGALLYHFAIVPIMRNRTVLSRILPFDHRSRIAICYGLLPPGSSSAYYSIAEGDLSAINHADSALVELYGRSRVKNMNFHTTQAHSGELESILSSGRASPSRLSM